MASVSFVAPAGDRYVIKAPSEGDDESLHEADALDAWGSDVAVRVIRRAGRVLLEERAVPGTDLSRVPEDHATTIAVELAQRMWRQASTPFRSVHHDVERWLAEAERAGSPLVGLARELHDEVGTRARWLVHGDFHHHNIVRDTTRFVVIDPKPYLADREYDVAPFLWNPMDNHMTDGAQTNRRIEAFANAGLDEFRIRAWAVIRGAYLRPQFADALRELVG